MRLLRKSIIHTIFISIFFILFCSTLYANTKIENTNSNRTSTTQQQKQQTDTNHNSDTKPLLFIIIAVIIGGIARHTLKKTSIPFTAALLIIGLGLGIIGRFDLLHQVNLGFTETGLSYIDGSIFWAAHIDPHILLYVFLPILIFEAAFAMDVHVFKKTFTNATIMAVPGILVAIGLTATIVIGIALSGIGLLKWDWSLALLFGAVISATDPVAVVAILKELGTSKKLGTLIEGESLLNDGTAIVIFMVILTSLTGIATDISPILEFFRVAFGGIAVGIIIAWLILKWIARVFNDRLVEMSAIIGAAYITFFIAESAFHVSGVLALVSLGLMLAGPGRTKISPEVQHFMHRFWDLAAFMANVMIFLIVGVVVAERTVFSSEDFLILGLIYIAIFIVRAIVIMAFYPIMKMIGYGINRKEATIVWWGALRGAIGLALALIVAGTEVLDEDIRNQFLFLTSGIVTLTLLINATTINMVVEKLGLTRLSIAKKIMLKNADDYLYKTSENTITKLHSDRFLRRANWEEVQKYAYKKNESLDNILTKEGVGFTVETRRRILEKEKNSYWKQFKVGLLGESAFQILTDQINTIIDKGGRLSSSQRTDLEDLIKPSKLLVIFRKIPILKYISENTFFNDLTDSYDCASGFIVAQEDSLKLIESMYRATNDADQKDRKILDILQREIEENRLFGLTYLRNIGKEYPEIYSSIATNKAIRRILNFEKRTIESMLTKGRITTQEANNWIKNVENRMQKLKDSPPQLEILDKHVLLKNAGWLDNISEEMQYLISDSFDLENYNESEIIFKEGALAKYMYIIVRGNVAGSSKGKQLYFYEAGDIIGADSFYSNKKLQITTEVLTPLTVLRIKYTTMKELLSKSIELEIKLKSAISKYNS